MTTIPNPAAPQPRDNGKYGHKERIELMGLHMDGHGTVTGTDYSCLPEGYREPVEGDFVAPPDPDMYYTPDFNNADQAYTYLQSVNVPVEVTTEMLERFRTPKTGPQPNRNAAMSDTVFYQGFFTREDPGFPEAREKALADFDAVTELRRGARMTVRQHAEVIAKCYHLLAAARQLNLMKPGEGDRLMDMPSGLRDINGHQFTIREVHLVFHPAGYNFNRLISEPYARRTARMTEERDNKQAEITRQENARLLARIEQLENTARTGLDDVQEQVRKGTLTTIEAVEIVANDPGQKRGFFR